ncbi:MAG: outer membrane protein assembly factor [Dysgonamonadaceae bacterium]|jgi:outer membrane protein assembly factor BamA|nr:outer membrane protein assembly factor [Dysgonamonadaceae bacterium]
MKKGLLLFAGVLFGLNVLSQNDTIIVEKNDKQDIVKKGISLGPLPVVAFDQDKGFQYGAILNIFDFGDGSHYPHPRQQWYIEASRYTKGTQQYFLTYDTKHLIPGIRMSLAGTVVYDQAMDFYGFNGYQSIFYPEILTPFYRVERLSMTAKADFAGNIWENKLFWQAGYYFAKHRYSPVDLKKINDGKDEDKQFRGETLFEKYINWGIIPEDEKDGGFVSALRTGLMYDTRDFEAAPSRGIWTEANLSLAPGFLGTTHPHYRYMLTFRHYVPVVKEQLTFAYRLNYQGTLGNYLPFYVMPVFSTIGREYDRDGIGGYRTVRGIMRNRIQGLDVGFFNAELRWKFLRTHLWKQNVFLGLNAFMDGGIVTRDYDLTYRGVHEIGIGIPPQEEYKIFIDTSKSDRLHTAAGAGFRIGINQNFIIAIDYAKPFNKQDGSGSLYINTGYLF